MNEHIEQFDSYHSEEGMFIKTISSFCDVIECISQSPCMLQLDDVILAKELLNVGRFTARDKLYLSKCLMLSRFIFPVEPPL